MNETAENFQPQNFNILQLEDIKIFRIVPKLLEKFLENTNCFRNILEFLKLHRMLTTNNNQ